MAKDAIELKDHSKEEIIEILKKENPPIEGKEKYAQLIIVVEFKKIHPDLGIIKGEYYEFDKLEYRGSLLLPLPRQISPTDIWSVIEVGKSKFCGFTLDSREMKAHEKLFDFFKRSFEDATLQDFIPGTRGKANE